MTEKQPKSVMVGYARVSTDDQSLTLQTDALLKAGVLPDNIHTDKKSGVVEKRPGLQLALKDLREGDTLVVWKLDRLSREPRQVYDLLDYLKKKGCKVVSITEGFDSDTAVGKFFIGVSVAFAAFERALIAERTTAGIAAIREKREKGGTWKWGRKATMTPDLIAKAGRLLNDADLRGPETAERLGVSTASIYAHWQSNPKWTKKSPKSVRRFIPRKPKK